MLIMLFMLIIQVYFKCAVVGNTLLYEATVLKYNRTFPGWTAIGVTRLLVFRENALLLYYYFRGFGD